MKSTGQSFKREVVCVLPRDVREQIRYLAGTQPTLSSREVAAEIGLGKTRTSEIMAELGLSSRRARGHLPGGQK